MSDVQPPDDGDGTGTAFGGIEPIEIQEAVSYTHLTLPTILRV